MTSTDASLIAVSIVSLMSLVGWVINLTSSQRAKDAQRRTNARLKKVEDTHELILSTLGEVKAMKSDIHMIKEHLMENKK